MNRMKKWAKMIFAMLLAVSLVFTSNSTAAFAFTVKNGTETLTEADGEIWQHYEFDGEQEGAPKKVFDFFDGSKAKNGLSVELTNDEIHNSGEEGPDGWYPTEDKNYVFVNNTSVLADLSDGIGVGFFRDNTVNIKDTSESGIEINGDGCDSELLPEDASDPANGIGDEIIANVDLLENMRTTAENPYDLFWNTDEFPVVVEVVLNGYDRPENSDFPISIASASGENVIDGWDKMKARVTEGSVTLSWSAESKPACIRIENGDDDADENTKFEDGWEIRDIEDGVTSVSINVGKKDFYCIEAIYENENPFDSFGPTEDFPVLIEVALVDYNRPNDSEFPLYVESVSDGNVIDGWDMMKARVAGGSIVLSWSAESKPTQICIKDGDDDYSSGDWEIRDIEDETSTSIKVGKDNREYYFIKAKYGNYGPEPEENHIIGVDFLPDLSSLSEDDDARLSLNIEGYRGEERFGLQDGHYEFDKSNSGQKLIDLSVPADATALNFRLQTAGKKVVSAKYAIGENEQPLSDDEINALTSEDGGFKIFVADGEENWIELIVFSVTLEDDNQGGGQGGSNDVTYSEDTTLSENTTKTDVNVKGAKLTIDTNCSLRIEHKLNIGENAAIVGTSDTSKLVFAPGAFSKGIDLYCNEGKLSGGFENSFENQGESPAEFSWDVESNKWVTDHNPNAGDAPWYTVSYGNSANLSTENGQVYAERVHVGDTTYTLIESEYNKSDSDLVFPMSDTIFHRKNEEVEEENWDPMLRYGIGGSDGDIMIRSDVTGVAIDFKFIPDFGYQLKNIYTNENEKDSLMDKFDAMEQVSSFTFEVMAGSNVHFEVKFVETNNTVTGNAGLASTAKIESTNAAESGTLEMKIDSGTQSANIPKDSEVLAAYDITLKNVVSKGEGRGNWETAMTDLGSNNATITLPVSDTTNYTYTVIRNHNGEETTLDTKVTEDGISFETNQFSTYTIVKKPVATKEPTPTVTPTVIPTSGPSVEPTPTVNPTAGPSAEPTPAVNPTVEPTAEPTPIPHVCKGEAVAEVPATCTESGTKAYYKCECGKFYEDEACTKEIEDLAAWLADENGGKIVAKGHTVVVDKAVAATSTKSGLTEGSHCSVCNEVLTAQVPTTYTKAGNVYTTSKTTVTYAAPAKTSVKTIEVPATVKVNGKTYKVTSIEAGAFENCKKLTTVKIGSNVKTIGDEAFKGCKNLKTLTIGTNVTTIGENAFAGCTKLKTVKLNSKIKTIDENAFSKCTSLTEIVIPDKVTEIADNAFNGCTKLKKVTIGKSVKTIGEKAFNGCKNLTSIKILSTKLTKISTDAFKGISSKAKFTVPSKKVASYTKLIKASGAPSKVSVTKN